MATETDPKKADDEQTRRSSHCSTASDVVHAWMRGECDYPGDSYVIWTMDEYMREHVRQRHYGHDVLASAELDSACQLIAAIRNHFSL